MLRLKEDPSEWRKFAIVTLAAGNAAAWLLRVRCGLASWSPVVVAFISLGVLAAAIAKPQWFRGWYRGGMAFSHRIGEAVGKVLLTILFLVLVTPIGLLLRLLGKDLLEIKRKPGEVTRWRTARNGKNFDRMY
jgi:hypothetical protein